MIEIRGDMFDCKTWTDQQGNPTRISPSAIVITTNGFVKRTGAAVMGRGCAKKAADAFPNLPLQLGQMITKHGNHVGIITTRLDTPIVSYPVKPVSEVCLPDKSNVVRHMRSQMTPGRKVPGWACRAKPELIVRSARELVQLTEEKGWLYVVMPRPGCGAGELEWENIKRLIAPILDNRFLSITWR